MRQFTNDEKTLMQLTKASNPYRAPKGYFDKLPERVMQKVKARQRRRLAIRWAVAAMLTGCVVTAGFSLFDRNTQDRQRNELAHTQYIEDALDYSMIDNAEIAYYLTEAE